MGRLLVTPAPATGVLHPTEGGSGQDHVQSGVVIHDMAGITEVTQRCLLTFLGHLLVVVGGAEVDMLHVNGVTPGLADRAGRVTV